MTPEMGVVMATLFDLFVVVRMLPWATRLFGFELCILLGPSLNRRTRRSTGGVRRGKGLVGVGLVVGPGLVVSLGLVVGLVVVPLVFRVLTCVSGALMGISAFGLTSNLVIMLSLKILMLTVDPVALTMVMIRFPPILLLGVITYLSKAFLLTLVFSDGTRNTFTVSSLFCVRSFWWFLLYFWCRGLLFVLRDVCMVRVFFRRIFG